MANEVKWIKISTDIFDNEKILLLKSMPDGKSMVVIWLQLLCLAGKQNNSGVFMLGKIPYTDEMFATVFRENLETVRMALRLFEQLGMVEIAEDVVMIKNWEKYQSTDRLEKLKEYQKEYHREYRKKQALLADGGRENSDDSDERKLYGKFDCKIPGKVKVNALDKDKDKDKDIDIDIKDKADKPQRHKYGEYTNVLLSDEDLEKLKNEFPSDWSNRIENLSSYKASTGKTYKNDLATIRNWARKEPVRAGTSSKHILQSENSAAEVERMRQMLRGMSK